MLNLHPLNSACVVALALLLVCLPALSAEPFDAPLLLLDANNGLVLKHDRANMPWYPASLTKVMNVYVAFAAIESGELSLEDKLTASAIAAGQPPTRLGLRKGTTLSVEETILAMITVSANDAAVVMAEHLAGTEIAFAARMTEAARSLGMIQTRFLNATGLPDEEQVTTARDMALLAQRLYQDFPQHFHYFENRQVSYRNRNRGTTNSMLGSYPGADGIKTGFTCSSGYNVIASAQRDERRLIGVVLGGRTAAERNRQMFRLLNAGFGSQVDPTAPNLSTLVVHGESAELPPTRLSVSECIRVARKNAQPGKLRGWGLLFGNYTDKRKANKVFRDARSALKGVAKTGRSTILKRKLERGTSWKALLVGYRRDDAGKACKVLRDNHIICMVVTPNVMNAKGFLLK